MPAGALLGAMVFVTALNIVTASGYVYPADLRRLVQVVSGAVIGLSFTRADLSMFRRLLRPALTLLAMMLGFNVLFAYILSRLTVLDLITALFAAAPGGISDIALIAVDFGANLHQVAILQIFRFVLIVSLFPFIVRRLLEPAGRNPTLTEAGAEQKEHQPDAGRPMRNAEKWARSFATLLVATSGAALARWLGLPAGVIIGALTATVVMGTVFQAAYLPKGARPVVQALAGCFIGSQITLATLSYLYQLLLPLALAFVQLLIMTFSTAWVLHRFCRMERATSLFSSIPGGIVEMSTIAQEMKLRVPEIVLMSTCRIIGVICVLPLLLFLLMRYVP